MMMQAHFHARSPGRIDFGGGGSDCPPYREEHGGAVVNAAIAMYVHATLIPREDPSITLVSTDLGRTVNAPCLDELTLGGGLDLLAGAVRRLRPDFGFRLEVESELPGGCGLSTSAAVLTSAIAVIQCAMGVECLPDEVYRLATQVEREDLALPGGSQDQFAAAHGGINYITFDSLFGEPVGLSVSPQTIFRLEQHLFLIYTGEAHMSGNVHEDIRRQYADPHSGSLGAMNGLKDVAKRMAHALEIGDLKSFAPLLYENWEHHKRLHPSCTNKRLDECYEILREAGVEGAKTCGAGGGGCVAAYAEGDVRRNVRKRLIEAGHEIWKVHFDQVGTVTYTDDAF